MPVNLRKIKIKNHKNCKHKFYNFLKYKFLNLRYFFYNFFLLFYTRYSQISRVAIEQKTLVFNYSVYLIFNNKFTTSSSEKVVNDVLGKILRKYIPNNIIEEANNNIKISYYNKYIASNHWI